VGNDGLVQLLIFLGFAGLLCWWQTGRARWWFFAAAATGLGVLTKSNALVLLPIALGLLWIRPGLDKAARIRLLAWGGGTVAAISGWLIGIRLWLEQTPSVVPNTIYLPATLRLATSPSDLLWFNPVRVLEHPFGNHLGWLQQEQGLWEFYFRSAFFGEFPFDPGLRWTGWLILLLAMGLLPLIGLGLWRAIRSAPVEHAYLWMPVLMLLSIHGIYRVFAPFVPSQDFRYTSLVLLPAGALALQAADALPRWLRWLAWVAMAVLSGVCAVFLTRLVS
jgi:4-amino-4-deoxy-L-arabinose transferase-like glycosyltransferase